MREKECVDKKNEHAVKLKKQSQMYDATYTQQQRAQAPTIHV